MQKKLGSNIDRWKPQKRFMIVYTTYQQRIVYTFYLTNGM